jgi:ribonuclease J
MQLTIHRGAHEIGGSCVELEADGRSLLLDLGTPLVDAAGDPFDEGALERPAQQLVESGELPNIPGLYGDGPCRVCGIVLSHAHQDHYGLTRFVRPDIPIHATRKTQALLRIMKMVFPEKSAKGPPCDLPEAWKRTQIGPFGVTVRPIGHSAPDAVTLEVEVGGKKVFYTGDIRGHGRRGKLFQHLLDSPPRDVDAMLMEGSSFGRRPDEYPYPDEQAVEDALVPILQRQSNLALLFCAAQNVDRLVSAFRAARRALRLFVMDYFTAFVLRELASTYPDSKLPQYDWDGVRLFYWRGHGGILERGQQIGFLGKVKKSAARIQIDELVERRNEILMLSRPNRTFEVLLSRLPSLEGLELIWSMWKDYLTGEDVFSRTCQHRGLKCRHTHTSGHASIRDLQRLVDAIKPRHLIPIPTFHPEDYEQESDCRVQEIEDGVPVDV